MAHLKKSGQGKSLGKEHVLRGLQFLTSVGYRVSEKINKYASKILHMIQERGCNFFTGCFKDLVCPKEKIHWCISL